MTNRPGLHLSIEGVRPGELHMAEDAALLAAAETGLASARAYRWPEPTVSLGRFQRAEAVLLDPSVPYALRPTGGAAVYHGHDVTLSLALPLQTLGTDARHVETVYRAMLRPLLTALHAVGVPATWPTEPVRDPQSAYCFGVRAPYDVVRSDTGQKCAGVALRITRGAALLQVSVPFRALRHDPRRMIAEATDAAVIPLDSGRLINAFAAALRTNFDVRTRLDSTLTRDEAVRAWLWNQWDPIGVNDVAEAADEYDGYVGAVSAVWQSPGQAAVLDRIRAGMGLPAERRTNDSGRP
ncbi:MAG: hypothetical protein SFX74_06170 [Fimbriimonadaceae bacterium]|nr:hypothetical protein [Fimbriimonadaceae bacterium]